MTTRADSLIRLGYWIACALAGAGFALTVFSSIELNTVSYLLFGGVTVFVIYVAYAAAQAIVDSDEGGPDQARAAPSKVTDVAVGPPTITSHRDRSNQRDPLTGAYLAERERQDPLTGRWS